MADDKKNIGPEVETPTEAPTQDFPGPEPALTEEEAAILEHEGRAALFEMGELFPDMSEPIMGSPDLFDMGDPAPDDKAEPAVPEAPDVTPPENPASEKEGQQTAIPGMDDPALAPSGKVVDFAAAREQAEQGEKPKRGRRPKAEKAEQAGLEEKKPDKPRKGRAAKKDQEAPEQGKPKKTKAEKAPTDKAAGGGAPAVAESPAAEAPSEPRDATRAVEEKIVYLDLTELHPFKDHPFGVRNDAEMQSLVESVRAGGVNQPALVRPREDGGYEIIAGHRRQMASELAGYKNMPCIVRNMTDDEAILAMTDDNLQHRDKILPTEKALAIKQQYEAIKHQGARGDDESAGKLSLESVGQRNNMSVKTVQRYIWLNDLVPDLKKIMDEGRLSFTPAVEISRIRPKHQQYIAVSIEGQQSSPTKSQASKLREMDQKNQLNADVIDAVLSQEKSKEGFDVIISSAELAEFFGKDKTPREMKDQIMALLSEWKEKQPPELGKPEKKTDLEK